MLTLAKFKSTDRETATAHNTQFHFRQLTALWLYPLYKLLYPFTRLPKPLFAPGNIKSCAIIFRTLYTQK